MKVAALQKADVHVSKAAVRSMTAADGVLVEMPPGLGFDVTGDTGSIGRFNARSDGMNASVEMDVKGDQTPRCFVGACSLTLVDGVERPLMSLFQRVVDDLRKGRYGY